MSITGITEQVIESLKNKIITCEYRPGQRLGEIEIAEDLGVSRTPVREAIKVLSEQNLMVNLPRRRTHIAEISSENLEELFTARKVIESSALDLINSNNENRDRILDHIDKTLTDAESLVEKTYIYELHKKRSDITTLFLYFHIALVENAGNEWMKTFYSMMIPSIARYIYIYLHASGVARRSIEHHREILIMLRNNEIDEAKQILTEHITFSCNTIKENIFNDQNGNILLNSSSFFLSDSETAS